MKNLSPEFCHKVREARRDAGLSQGELAAEIGCKQSAISMFEQGDGTKLSDAAIEKLSKKFDIAIVSVAAENPRLAAAQAHSVHEPHTGYCPNPACPGHKGYRVGERSYRLPDREAQDPVGGRFCALCGEVLERKCPNCGAPVHDGAVCSFCGEPYVTLAS